MTKTLSGVTIRRTETIRKIGSLLRKASRDAKERQGNHAPSPRGAFKGKAAEDIAEELGISASSVERIVRVLKSGRKGLIRSMSSGDITANIAVQELLKKQVK